MTCALLRAKIWENKSPSAKNNICASFFNILNIEIQ